MRDGLVWQINGKRMEESLNGNLYFFLLILKVVSILIPLKIHRIKGMERCWVCKILFTCIK